MWEVSRQGGLGLSSITAYSAGEIIFFDSKPEDGLDCRVWLAVDGVFHIVHFDEMTAKILGSKGKSPITEETFLAMMFISPNMVVQVFWGYNRVAYPTDGHVVIKIDHDA